MVIDGVKDNRITLLACFILMILVYIIELESGHTT